MAIAEKSALGKVKKSYAGAVLYEVYGKTRMRSKAGSFKDAKTPVQKSQRSRFVMLTRLSCSLKLLIRRTFVNDAADMSQHHKFMKLNYARGVVSGEFPNYSIDYSKMLISKGKLLGVEEGIVCSEPGNKVIIKWKDNSGVKHSKSTHKVMVLLINETRKFSRVYFDVGTRSDTKLEITTPLEWENNVFHVYFLFKAANKEVFSDSVYLGHVTLVP